MSGLRLSSPQQARGTILRATFAGQVGLLIRAHESRPESPSSSRAAARSAGDRR
jgi:hypothetical protein